MTRGFPSRPPSSARCGTSSAVRSSCRSSRDCGRKGLCSASARSHRTSTGRAVPRFRWRAASSPTPGSHQIKQGACGRDLGGEPIHPRRPHHPHPAAFKSASAFCSPTPPASLALPAVQHWRGPSPSVPLADASCSSRHRQVTPPTHPASRLLLVEAAAHRAGCAPHRRLLFNSRRLRYRLPPFHLPPPRCAHPSTATSPRPPIRLRLFFLFHLI